MDIRPPNPGQGALHTASGEARITWFLGLHGRPSVKLVTIAQGFASSITVSAGGRVANAKDIIDVMMLAAFPDTTLHFAARGPDAQTAVDTLVELVIDDFHLG